MLSQRIEYENWNYSDYEKVMPPRLGQAKMERVRRYAVRLATIPAMFVTANIIAGGAFAELLAAYWCDGREIDMIWWTPMKRQEVETLVLDMWREERAAVEGAACEAGGDRFEEGVWQ